MERPPHHFGLHPFPLQGPMPPRGPPGYGPGLGPGPPAMGQQWGPPPGPGWGPAGPPAPYPPPPPEFQNQQPPPVFRGPPGPQFGGPGAPAAYQAGAPGPLLAAPGPVLPFSPQGPLPGDAAPFGRGGFRPGPRGGRGGRGPRAPEGGGRAGRGRGGEHGPRGRGDRGRRGGRGGSMGRGELGGRQPGPAFGSSAGASAAANTAPQAMGHGGSGFACKPCDKTFNSSATLQAHLQTHEACTEAGCSFSAPARRLKEHRVEAHGKVAPPSSARAKRAAEFRARESAESLRRWVEERKRNFPTTANIQRKAQEAQERKARGELAPDEEARARRARIREVVEMQAALGLPMCEIPSYYLSDGGRGGRGRGWEGGRGFRGRGGRGFASPGFPYQDGGFRGRGRQGRGRGRWPGRGWGHGFGEGGDGGALLVAQSSRHFSAEDGSQGTKRDRSEGDEGPSGDAERSVKAKVEGADAAQEEDDEGLEGAEELQAAEHMDEGEAEKGEEDEGFEEDRDEEGDGEDDGEDEGNAVEDEGQHGGAERVMAPSDEGLAETHAPRDPSAQESNVGEAIPRSTGAPGPDDPIPGAAAPRHPSPADAAAVSSGQSAQAHSLRPSGAPQLPPQDGGQSDKARVGCAASPSVPGSPMPGPCRAEAAAGMLEARVPNGEARAASDGITLTSNAGDSGRGLDPRSGDAHRNDAPLPTAAESTCATPPAPDEAVLGQDSAATGAASAALPWSSLAADDGAQSAAQVPALNGNGPGPDLDRSPESRAGANGPPSRKARRKGARPCKYFQRGFCQMGDSCNFAHGPGGIPPAMNGGPTDARAQGLGPARQHGEGDAGVEEVRDLVSWRPWERQPSLLARLLEKDVRREQSQILQAIRFVVSNDFLLAYPYKPLSYFPWVDQAGKGDKGPAE